VVFLFCFAFHYLSISCYHSLIWLVYMEHFTYVMSSVYRVPVHILLVIFFIILNISVCQRWRDRKIFLEIYEFWAM
jgi:hypothetical protein